MYMYMHVKVSAIYLYRVYVTYQLCISGDNFVINCLRNLPVAFVTCQLYISVVNILINCLYSYDVSF